MSEWVLILLFYVGPMGETDSLATTHIVRFVSKDACVAAGKEAEKLTLGSVKVTRWVCISQTGSTK
jgi:hypothetical protein